MGWDEVVGAVSPYVVRIETPEGTGTGFLCLYNYDQSWIGIATAAHVIERADEWHQPIRIHCQQADEPILLNFADRVIFINALNDSAVILLPNSFRLNQNLIPLLPTTMELPIGTSIGWLGYPGITTDTLCFFTGTVSAIRRIDGQAHSRSYLVDGVAINGVSGGPVLYHNTRDNGIYIVGILTAYMINRQRGEALPGLSVAQDVSHFHGVLQTVRGIDEARQRRSELEGGETSPQGDQPSPVLRNPPTF